LARRSTSRLVPRYRFEISWSVRYSRFSHRHLLRIRGCFVVRGGGAAFFAEQVPPPCSNGGRWFEIRGCAILGSAIGSASPANGQSGGSRSGTTVPLLAPPR